MPWCWPTEGHWAGFLAAGANHGFIPRRADALAFAQTTRGPSWWSMKPCGIAGDLVFGSLRFGKSRDNPG